MLNGPLEIAWDIQCSSPSAATEVQSLLEREADLGRMKRVTWTGGGAARDESYRLGDYFRTIRVEPSGGTTAQGLRLVFERLPEAGRYWRDLMVGFLQSVRVLDEKATITMAYRHEEAPVQVDRV